MAIPFLLLSLARRRRDLPYPWMFWMFGIFIVGCGLTHLMEVVTSYYPVYRLAAVVKVVTAVASLATALALAPLVPKALALRGPAQLEREVRQRTADLEEANRTLLAEVAVREGAEVALRQAHEDLERQVGDRTAALARANAELERSNQELQSFAFVASHDLQEPLRKIQSFGEILREECGDSLGETGRDYVGRMRRAASRMSALIESLLDYSRVAQGEMRFTPVDLGVVAAEVVEDLEPRIREAGGRVGLGPLPVVDANATYFRQLLQNLIGNALKFHRPGVPPDVQVRAEVISPAGGEPLCELSVRDNGIGFEPRHAVRIFDVFQRLHGRGDFEGTGIGLAICKRIAERHGGTIAAEGRPGEGATFVVTFPLQRNP